MTDPVERRLTSLEDWRHQLEVKQAKADSDRVHLDKDLREVKETLKEIKGNLAKVVWLILASIIGGFMTWAMSGGFATGG